LNVKDAIGKYLEHPPATWAGVTVRHLLTHTSGIADYQQLPDYDKTRRLFTDAESFIRRVKAEPMHFPPGRRFEYSNTNYILLGYIIESVSGKPYEAFLKERILQPLGMADTGYNHAEPIVRNRAAGYVWRRSLVNADFTDMENPFSSGGLYSTVEDLQRFVHALHGGKLLSKRSLEAMFDASGGEYGYGWYIGQWFGRKFAQHQGFIDGFRSILVHFPAEDICIVFLSNVENTRMGELTQTLAAIVLGEKYSLAEVGSPIDTVGGLAPVKVDPKVYDSYVGRYMLPMGMLTVTRDGDKLLVEFADEPGKTEVIPESETQFFIRGPAGVRVIFLKDANGRAAQAKVIVRGREFVGDRMP
jgi:CubicO group peptidase (beta-lactamase class C family)